MELADFLKSGLQKAPNWATLPLLRLNCLGDLMYGRRCRDFKRGIPRLDPERMLTEMANYAIAHVPYYRERYRGVTIRSVADFQACFSFIDKAEVTAHFNEFISDEAARIPHVVLYTSGTTGRPMKVIQPADRYVTEMAFLTSFLDHSGWNYGVKASVRKQQMPPGRDFMVNPATKEIIFDGYRTDREYLTRMMRTIRRCGADTLNGFGTNITQLLHMFLKYGIDISPIKRVIMTSEPVLPEYYAFIEDRLGIKIVSHYGHTEKLILMEQISRDRLAVEPGYGFTEIIGPDGLPARPGCRGELTGSTFYNHVMPLLRYRTGDFTVPTGESVTIDGIVKPTVGRVSGRHDKVLMYRHDGTTASATAFNIHDERRMSFEAVQYVQERRGYLKVLVVKGDNYNADDEAFMLRHFGYAMLGREYVSVEYVDTLRSLPNGKTPIAINTTTS